MPSSLEVHGVRVDGHLADRGEVVREVVGGVELAVLGAVSAALLVRGAPGEETEEAGAAGGDAAECLDEQQRQCVYTTRMTGLRGSIKTQGCSPCSPRFVRDLGATAGAPHQGFEARHSRPGSTGRNDPNRFSTASCACSDAGDSS